jgi:teichuronic acid biosynthesis glycosyltransferase TuaC
MRILTFTSLFPNKVQRDLGIFIYQRTKNIAQLPDTSVDVVAPVPYFPSWLKIDRWKGYSQVPKEERFGELRVLHPRYPLLPGILMPFHGLLMFLGCLNQVRKLQREMRFDCIDAHYVYPDGFAAVLLGRALDIPVFVSARGSDINIFPKFVLVRPMIRWTLRQATGLIAVSAALMNLMLALHDSKEKTRVIPNGVDSNRFHPMDRTEARKKLGIAEDGVVLVSVGSLKAVKRHELLMQALLRVSGKFPDLRLYIVGEGPLRSKLEAQTEKMGLARRVILVGSKPNEELPLWFNAADISCLASTSEGWPNVLMESIACGTPVVAANVGGIPEIVNSPELGQLVDNNPESFAGGIFSALSHSWNRGALVREGKQRDWLCVACEVREFLLLQLQRTSQPITGSEENNSAQPFG